MLFWLLVIIFIIGLILNTFYKNNISCIIANVSGILLGIATTFLIIQYLTIDVCIEANKERYKALIYKVESGACRDDFGLLSKEVIDEVQEWNTDLASYQEIQDDFWLGIFYPNVYDEVEKIDYERYNKEGYIE